MPFVRDDIYKSAPCARHWQTVLKRTIREADRGDRAREAADGAVRKDIRNELPSDLMTELDRRCSDPGWDLFRSRFDDLPDGGGVLADTLISRLRFREAQGDVSRQTLEDVSTQVISERMRSRQDALSGHVLKERGQRPSECVQALAQAMSSLSARSYARELLENSGRVSAPSRRAPQLDDALPVL